MVYWLMKQVHINTSSDTEEESTRRYVRPDEVERKKERDKERRGRVEREGKKERKNNRKEHPPIIPSYKVNLNAYV